MVQTSGWTWWWALASWLEAALARDPWQPLAQVLKSVSQLEYLSCHR